MLSIQLRTMDHLARIAMKNAANCVKYGEMQGYRNRNMSNAYCGPGIRLSGPHLSEGLLNAMSILHCRALKRDDNVQVLGFTCVSPTTHGRFLARDSFSPLKNSTYIRAREFSCRPPSEVRFFRAPARA